jgi:hypothetical protein
MHKQDIDPRTGRGRREIAEAFGWHAAWRACIAALESDVTTCGNPWATHPDHAIQKELFEARFELKWLDHPANPANA